MLERSPWHIAFDLIVMDRYWAQQRDEVERQRQARGLPPTRHRSYPIRGNRGTGSSLPDPAPPPERR